MTIPREIKMIAQAVVDGDETAALALFDALTEVRHKLGTDPSSAEAVFADVMRACGRVIRYRMEDAGIQTLAELLVKSPEEVLDWQQVGMTKLNHLRDALASRGFHLRGDEVYLKNYPQSQTIRALSKAGIQLDVQREIEKYGNCSEDEWQRHCNRIVAHYERGS